MALFEIVVLVFSAIIHEYMHGWMADYLGDPTAKNAGRLTLNPLSHIDLFGSIIVPFFLIASGSNFVLGWAKPVPYNPNNLRDKKYGNAKVALAGPMGNFIVAVVFALIFRLAPLSLQMQMFVQIIIYINLLLMIFNLVPIPPMDGSKIVLDFLPYHLKIKYLKLEQYGMFLVLLFVMFGFAFIQPIINFLFNVLTGI